MNIFLNGWKQEDFDCKFPWSHPSYSMVMQGRLENIKLFDGVMVHGNTFVL